DEVGSERAGPSAAEHLLVGVLLETDYQRLPFPQGGRPQVAGGAAQMGRQGVVVGRVLLHVKGNRPLPLGHDDAVGTLGQGECLIPAAAVLARVGLPSYLPSILLKELSSSPAARSPLAMVEPLDLARHADSFR